jgi:hypothetical protein
VGHVKALLAILATLALWTTFLVAPSHTVLALLAYAWWTGRL